MLHFRSFFENTDLVNQINQKIRTFFWRRNRSWKKLLNTEPYTSLTKIHDLLITNNPYSAYYVQGIVLALLVIDLFPEEFVAISRINNLKQLVINSLKQPITSSEEAVSLVKTMKDGNSPIRIGIDTLWTTDIMRMQPFIENRNH